MLGYLRCQLLCCIIASLCKVHRSLLDMHLDLLSVGALSSHFPSISCRLPRMLVALMSLPLWGSMAWANPPTWRR